MASETWGLARLLGALLLLAAKRAAPLIHATLGSARWGELVDTLAGQVLPRPQPWLITAALAAVGGLIAALGSGFGLVASVPFAALALFAGARVRYLHTAYGRTRETFGSAGWADHSELRDPTSAHAVREEAVARRPSLAMHVTDAAHENVGSIARRTAAAARRSILVDRLPVSECGSWLGRSAVGPWWGSEVYASLGDVLGVIGPSDTGKNALLIHHVLDAPGAVLSTSITPDIYLLTAVIRAKFAVSGRVYLFNPDGLAGLGSTLRWDPVRGCARIREANSRARLLVGGRYRSSDDDGSRDRWASEVLAGLLMVADLAELNMRDVARWVDYPADREHGLEQALHLMEGPHIGRVPGVLVDSLRRALSAAEDDVGASVFPTLRAATGFMSDPTVAALCTPGRDEDTFDVAAFIAARSTLYLLGSEDQKSGTAPLLAALAGHLHSTAKRLAARSGAFGRFDPPLLLSLDAAAVIAPVPLPDVVADAARHGITVEWTAQSPSQLRSRWRDAGADALLAGTDALMVYGGVTTTQDLHWVSKLCGTYVEGAADPGAPDKLAGRKVPVCPAERVQLLVQWHALLIYRADVVTQVRITPAWKRADVRAAGLPAGASLPPRRSDRPNPARPAPRSSSPSSWRSASPRPVRAARAPDPAARRPTISPGGGPDPSGRLDPSAESGRGGAARRQPYDQMTAPDSTSGHREDRPEEERAA